MSPADLARSEARRMALVLREIGCEGAPVAGGWMAADAEGSWVCRAAGLGVDGPVSADDVDALVAFYGGRGRHAEVQATPYQHPTLFEQLAARAFTVHDLDTVLACSTAHVALAQPVDGLAFRVVDPADPQDVDLFVAAQREGFETTGEYDLVTEKVARHARITAWLLTVHGEIVGSGALEVYEGTAALIAGSVLPGARQRGVHRAFLAYRLGVARDLGCHTALIGSLPGHTTERNALRCGFRPVYTQLTFRRPLDG